MDPEEVGRSDQEIAYPVIAEERSVELTSHDIALIVLIRRDIENNPEGLLSISYSSIQALSPKSEPFWEKGMYANQNTVTKLRNRFTLEKLYAEFAIEGDESDD